MKPFDLPACYTLVILACLPSAGLALTSGPNLPEYTGFESVEATDLVNLSTGNFSWSVPVMTVPGPGIGFPIVLSYHASPNMKDEGSWVGLGWNLQAGSISRQVNMLPDDMKKVPILVEVKSSKLHGWSNTISYNGVSVGISYRSDEGYGGTIGYDMLSSANVPVSLNVTTGFGSARGQSGVSVGLSLGKQVGSGNEWVNRVGATVAVGISQAGGVEAGLTAGISLANTNPSIPSQAASQSLFSLGISLSDGSGLSWGGSAVGIGYSASSPQSRMVMDYQGGFIIPAYIPGYGFISFTHSEWVGHFLGVENDLNYGFLYADRIGMGCADDATSQNCHQPLPGESAKRRHEFMGAVRPMQGAAQDGRLVKAAEDSYFVNAQGVSGAFKPYRREDGDYLNALDKTSDWDFTWEWPFTDKRTVDRTKSLESKSNLLNTDLRSSSMDGSGDVYWRYLDDAGGTEYTDPVHRDKTALYSARSRKVVPLIASDGSGRLQGFTITAANGMRYEFNFPLYNVVDLKRGYEDGGTDLTKATTQAYTWPYAYSWLMTAMKSPDFIDLDQDGAMTEKDIGGWVRFEYGDGTGDAGNGKKPLQNWRAPFCNIPNPTDKQFYSPAPQNGANSYSDGIVYSTSRSSAEGLKEIAYLQAIETPSHKATFTTKPRQDNAPQPLFRGYGLPYDPEYGTSSIAYEINSGSQYGTVTMNIPAGHIIYPGIEDSRLKNGDVVNITVAWNWKVLWGVKKANGTCEMMGNSDYTIGSTNMTFSNYVVGTTASLKHKFASSTYGSCGTGGFNPSFAQRVSKTITSLKENGNRSRALQSISLRSKESNQEVSFVDFTTDYSLSPNTPNSAASNHGKLTLKELKLGATVSGPFTPPYKFGYENNPAYQSGNWVQYELPEWDRWGNRCWNCYDNYHEPSVPFKDGKFDGGAWNLDRIRTPSGAEIAVKYDARRFHYVGSEPVGTPLGGSPAQWEMLIASGGMDGQFTAGNNYLEYIINIGTARKKLAAKGLVPVNLRLVAVLEDGTAGLVYLTNFGIPYNGNKVLKKLKEWSNQNSIDYTFSQAEVGDQFWLSYWRDAGLKSARIDYRIYAIVTDAAGGGKYATEDFANGVVATEVSLREPYSNAVQRTQYSYDGGVTPVLPATFSNYSDSRHPGGRGYEYFSGNAAVYYSKVTATVNSRKKTEYRFITPKDMKVIYSMPEEVYPPADEGNQLSQVNITDLGSLWGSLYLKEEFGDGAAVPIRSLRNFWAYNRKAMPANHRPLLDVNNASATVLEEHQTNKDNPDYYVSNAEPGTANHIGEHQTLASQRYFDKNGCEVDNCKQKSIRTTQTVYRRLLPMPSRQVSILDNLKSESFLYYPDFHTGTSLKKRTRNSDNSEQVVSVIPAYHKYEPMLRANMLDQTYAKTTYVYGPGERSGTGFNTDESATRATASELTFWRPFDKGGSLYTGSELDAQGMRKFQTLAWKADLNGTRPALAIPDDFCRYYAGTIIYCNSSVWEGMVPNWVIREQVNRYDGYGHSIDVMDQHKVNSTTQYGHRNLFPVAFTVNTSIPKSPVDKQFQAFHESFESMEDIGRGLINYPASQWTVNPMKSKTGAQSLVVKNMPGKMVCFDLGYLLPNKAYEASVWYFDATDGASSTDAAATRPGIFVGENAGCAAENHPNNAAPGSAEYAGRATGSKRWKRISATIGAGTCGDASTLDPAILCLYASKIGPGASVAYDELRVLPSDAAMSTVAYDSRGRIISSADSRETVTSYEYDHLGNLSGIRNDDGALVSEQANKVGDR